MSGDRFEDQAVVGGELVRGYMATNGRTRPQNATELEIETQVTLTAAAKQQLEDLTFERQAIVSLLEDDFYSVAEIAAHLKLPLRAVVVLTSEMVGEGLLDAQSVVSTPDEDMLQKIRVALVAL